MTSAVVAVGDSELRERLSKELRSLSVETHSVGTLEESLERVRGERFDLLFTDLSFPDGAGFELLEEARDGEGRTIVVVGDIQGLTSAEEVLRLGLADFMPTPVDRERLRRMLRGLEESEELGRRIARHREEVDAGHFGSMVGRSEAMRQVFDRIARVAPSSATVLVTGESGTGKEMVARTIHELGRRSPGPFVPVNCGAISPTLMESELFGHERGSFTGATRTHRGFFERADRGTLFLDEITEMPLELQVKLLRVLETSRITRIGAETDRRVDVRVVAATNRPPEEAIERGNLRRDLYYRLKVLQLEVPPLRHRRDDIRPLAEHFVDQIIEREGRPKRLPGAVVEILERYHWPGNARELRNSLYTAYLLSPGEEIRAEALPSDVTGPEDAGEFDGIAIRIRVGSSIEDAERRLILTTLAHMDGNKTRAAETLGISVKTLYNRLHAYGAMGTTAESGDDSA